MIYLFLKTVMRKTLNFFKYHVFTFHILILQKFFKFEKWHIYGSSQPRYTETVSEISNSLAEKGIVVEVGCGLGNILRRLENPIRIGFDIDLRVVNAAKLVNVHNRIQFFEGSFSEASKISDIQTLIAINWVHNIKSQDLIQYLVNFPSVYFITEGVENYTYFHSRELFEPYFDILRDIQIENRHIFLLVKKQNFVI